MESLVGTGAPTFEILIGLGLEAHSFFFFSDISKCREDKCFDMAFFPRKHPQIVFILFGRGEQFYISVDTKETKNEKYYQPFVRDISLELLQLKKSRSDIKCFM